MIGRGAGARSAEATRGQLESTRAPAAWCCSLEPQASARAGSSKRSAEWIAHGHRRLSGQCTVTEGAPPLRPREALLRESNVALPDLPVSRPDRWAHFVKLRDALERVARGRPLLITLEDVHFADDESLAFLHFLASDPAVPGAVPGELPQSARASLEPFFRDLMRHAEVVVLGPLDEGGLAEAAAQLSRSRGSTRELERDAPASAAGNPLFIKEMPRAARPAEPSH